MTPGRVRAGFRLARGTAGPPASAAKYAKPGPGRPAGPKNTHKAPSHPAGKTSLQPHSIAGKERKQAQRARKAAKQAGQTES